MLFELKMDVLFSLVRVRHAALHPPPPPPTSSPFIFSVVFQSSRRSLTTCVYAPMLVALSFPFLLRWDENDVEVDSWHHSPCLTSLLRGRSALSLNAVMTARWLSTKRQNPHLVLKNQFDHRFWLHWLDLVVNWLKLNKSPVAFYH